MCQILPVPLVRSIRSCDGSQNVLVIAYAAARTYADSKILLDTN